MPLCPQFNNVNSRYFESNDYFNRSQQIPRTWNIDDTLRKLKTTPCKQAYTKFQFHDKPRKHFTRHMSCLSQLTDATRCQILRLNAPNSIASGAPPQTPLGELTALPRPPSWWGGANCPLPKNPPPIWALRASPLLSVPVTFSQILAPVSHSVE